LTADRKQHTAVGRPSVKHIG